MPRTEHLAAARRLSGLVFGGAHYRVEIAAAIADAGGVANTAELAGELKLNRQTVNHELQKLKTAGLLQCTDGSGRKVFLMAVPSGYWALAQEFREKAKELLDTVPRY